MWSRCFISPTISYHILQSKAVITDHPSLFLFSPILCNAILLNAMHIGDCYRDFPLRPVCCRNPLVSRSRQGKGYRQKDTSSPTARIVILLLRVLLREMYFFFAVIIIFPFFKKKQCGKVCAMRHYKILGQDAFRAGCRRVWAGCLRVFRAGCLRVFRAGCLRVWAQDPSSRS